MHSTKFWDGPYFQGVHDLPKIFICCPMFDSKLLVSEVMCPDKHLSEYLHYLKLVSSSAFTFYHFQKAGEWKSLCDWL